MIAEEKTDIFQEGGKAAILAENMSFPIKPRN